MLAQVKFVFGSDIYWINSFYCFSIFLSSDSGFFLHPFVTIYEWNRNYLELSKQFRTLIHGFKPTVSHYLILPSGQSQKYIKETGGKCLRSGYLCLPYNEGCYSSRRTITYQILFCTLFPGISVHKILRYVSIIFHQGDLSYLYVLKHRT